MKGLMALLLVMVIIFPAAGFAKEETKKLPPNQILITDGKIKNPIIIQRVLFTDDYIVIQFTRDRIVTNTYDGVPSLKIIYTDERGKPHQVHIDKKGGYILAGSEMIPFPAKLVNLEVYDPFIDD